MSEIRNKSAPFFQYTNRNHYEESSQEEYALEFEEALKRVGSCKFEPGHANLSDFAQAPFQATSIFADWVDFSKAYETNLVRFEWSDQTGLHCTLLNGPMCGLMIQVIREGPILICFLIAPTISHFDQLCEIKTSLIEKLAVIRCQLKVKHVSKL